MRLLHLIMVGILVGALCSCDSGGNGDESEEGGDSPEPANITMADQMLSQERSFGDDINLTITVPEGATVEDPYPSVFDIYTGERDNTYFHLRVQVGWHADMEQKKGEIEAAYIESYELLVDEYHLLVYEKVFATGIDRGFYANVQIDGDNYECESVSPTMTAFTRAQVDRMVEACLSMTSPTGATAVPAVPPPPPYEPGPLLENTPVEGLELALSYPDNLDVQIEGDTATMTAEGFYPVTIVSQPLTLENAVLTVTVNGEQQLSTGETWEGNTQIFQTDCQLVRCTVDHPNPYDGDLRDIGRAICDSIAVPAPPNEGIVEQVRRASRSYGGQCTAADEAYEDPFYALLDSDPIRGAAEACWGEATAGGTWTEAIPSLNVTWRPGRSGADAFTHDLTGTMADTTTLLACIDTAFASVSGQLPAATVSGSCTVLLMATFDLGHRPVCD